MLITSCYNIDHVIKDHMMSLSHEMGQLLISISLIFFLILKI